MGPVRSSSMLSRIAQLPRAARRWITTSPVGKSATATFSASSLGITILHNFDAVAPGVLTPFGAAVWAMPPALLLSAGVGGVVKLVKSEAAARTVNVVRSGVSSAAGSVAKSARQARSELSSLKESVVQGVAGVFPGWGGDSALKGRMQELQGELDAAREQAQVSEGQLATIRTERDGRYREVQLIGADGGALQQEYCFVSGRVEKTQLPGSSERQDEIYKALVKAGYINQKGTVPLRFEKEGNVSRVDLSLAPQEKARVLAILHQEVRKKLGSGGQAEVFLVSNVTEGGSLQAFKHLKYKCMRGTVEFDRFRREVRLLEGLIDLPGPVDVYGLGVLDDRPFFVMEYVTGIGLDQLTKRFGRIELKYAVAFVRDLASTLVDVHDRNVVHRDLKPPNAKIDRSGRVRLLDFGIARQTDSAYTLSRDNQTVGTPGYMPPEQFITHEVDGRADIFSLVCILFEIVTGKQLYPLIEEDRRNVEMYYRRMLRTWWDPKKEGTDRVPDFIPLLSIPYTDTIILGETHRQLRDIFARSLAPKADDRCPDAATLVAELGELQDTINEGYEKQFGT